ncbi:MAG: MFS transporter [Candidatus Nezhaarchaeales archaeon]
MRLNSVVKSLIILDTNMLAASGLITPIFAIFVANNIIGGSAAVVGVATSIYMVLFSIVRLISAYYVDKVLNETQRIALLSTGTIIVGASFLLYVFATYPWQVYVLQALNGIGTALRYSSIMSLFTRYIDKGHESLEWGFYAVSTSLGQAAAASIGGLLADHFGFSTVFVIVGVIILMSSITSPSLHREVKRAYTAGK